MPTTLGWGGDCVTTLGWGEPQSFDFEARQDDVLSIHDAAFRAVDFQRSETVVLTSYDTFRRAAGTFRSFDDVLTVEDFFVKSAESKRRSLDTIGVLDQLVPVRISLGVDDRAWVIDPICAVVEKVIEPGCSYQFVAENELEHIAFQSAVLWFFSPHADRAKFKVFREVLSHSADMDNMVISLVDDYISRGGTMTIPLASPMNPGAAQRDPQTGQPYQRETVRHIVEITNLDSKWRGFRVEISGWAARLTYLPAIK